MARHTSAPPLLLAIAFAASLCAWSSAHAQDADLDLAAFEYLDVIETTDGSLWKGVVIEETPSVSYKLAIAGGSVHVIEAGDVARISKRRNPDFRRRSSIARGADPDPGAASYGPERARRLPAPRARPGARLEPELGIVFPAGDLADLPESDLNSPWRTSVTPGLRAGYEVLFGNIGVGGGALARFTYWRFDLPADEQGDLAHWTLETHLYGRVALHAGPFVGFGGLSLGLDTNYVYLDDGAMERSETSLGVGINLQTGVEVLLSDGLGMKFGFDYHPGTDTIVDGNDESVAYHALFVGTSLHL